MARRRSKSQSFDDDDSIFDRPTRGGMFHLTENIIRKFDGKDKTYAVTKWIQDIEENGDIFEWTPKQRLLVARRSLNGTAALWLNSEKTFPCWDTLKIAISKEFPDTIDAKTIHEMMSAKKKKSNESCIDYMFAMKELGRRGKMADYVAIKYVVDGIQDQEINKIMLYGVTTYAELKEKLKIYEILKEKMKKEPIHGKEQKITNTREWSSKVRCYSCGEKSHKSEDCPKKMQGKKCFNCNVFGHISSQCPAKAEASSATASSARTEQQPKRTYIATTQEGANTIFENQSDEVHNAMNAVIGSANSTVRDKCHNSEVDILKVNKECKVLKKTLKLVKLCNNNEIHALIDTGSEVNLVTMDYYEQIGSPTCFKNVNTVLTGLGSSKVISSEQFKTNIEIDGYTYRDIIFYVIPRDSIPIKVILGHEFLRNVITVMKDGLVWMKPNDWLFKVNCFPCSIDIVGHVMNENVRNEVTRLVDEYRPCQTKEAPIELKITLKDDIPVAQRPRRISPKEQDEVDKQVKEWLEQGVIRVSFSEYTSPIVLVRKKNGNIRICVDYRLINRKMLKDEYPLPIIDELIDRLAPARIFSALDLKNGFFHLRVSKDSIKYTSFVTMNGQYEFLKAPFGLSICPKVFTRFISIIFRDLITRGIVIVFIDDLLIPAINEAQAVARLREVLQLAMEYGLQINWKKSQLLVRKVEYLGHVIEGGTVMPSSGKTDAVIKFPEPRNEKQLQSFLGLCSYFRKYIQNYAVIARPLTDMLRKDKKFEFNNEHRLVFNMLKEKLTSKPVLKIYEPKAETELHTDASSIAYAAILLQKDDNSELHPVHYMSKRTTDAESKYTSYELEALAIIEGIKKFRHYLYGKHFKIVTDCKAFQMTLNKKDLAMSTRVARWILFLQDYDFTIEHREGSKMKHTDALSRNPYVALIFSDLHSDLRRAQESDNGLNAIINILRDGKLYNDFYLQGGLLCKGPQHCLVVPQKMEIEIIKRAHDNGHFSKKKTMELINKDYYIPKLEKKIEDYIATCIPCLLASRKEGKREGFLNPIEKGDTPLHTLHLDHIGPLTETRKQYNYILTIVDAFTKFVWLFPTKSTSTQEVLNKLEIHQQVFGNPIRIISDRGTAFTSNDFAQYCKEEEIEHVKITTGVPRGNGQVERVHRTIISVLTKLSVEKPTLWYKLVSRVQRALNSTYHRSINSTPFQLLFGIKMKRKEDIQLLDLLMEEERHNFIDSREELRKEAKKQIFKVQEENRRNYNKKMKECTIYKEGDLVAVKRTQFGTGMKLKPKFLGPYRIVKVKRKNRYNVEKADAQVEGPNKTTTSADFMKKWPDYLSD